MLSSKIYQKPTSLCSVSERAGKIPVRLIDRKARQPMTVISLLAVLVRVLLFFVILPPIFVGLDSGETVMVEYLSIISRTTEDAGAVDTPPASLF
jgi:hypothetical protein